MRQDVPSWNSLGVRKHCTSARKTNARYKAKITTIYYAPVIAQALLRQSERELTIYIFCLSFWVSKGTFFKKSPWPPEENEGRCRYGQNKRT